MDTQDIEDSKAIESARKQLQGDRAGLQKLNELVKVYKVIRAQFKEFDTATTDRSRVAGTTQQETLGPLFTGQSALLSTFKLLGNGGKNNINYGNYEEFASAEALDSLKNSKGDF